MRVNWNGTERMQRLLGTLGLLALVVSANAQWIWQQQCYSNHWYAACAGDPCSNVLIRWTFNNWGQVNCGPMESQHFPPVGSDVVFPGGADASLLNANIVDVRSILVSSGATFTWLSGRIVLRDPANNNAPGVLHNWGTIIKEEGNFDSYLEGLLVNEGTLVHEGGYIYLRNATLRNAASGVLLLNAGVLERDSSSSTHRIENFGTLRTSSNNAIRVPLQQQGAQVAVEGGILYLTAGGTHTDVSWSVASGATLFFRGGTHAFEGTHAGAIEGTLQTEFYAVLQAGGGVACVQLHGQRADLA